MKKKIEELETRVKSLEQQIDILKLALNRSEYHYHFTPQPAPPSPLPYTGPWYDTTCAGLEGNARGLG